MTTTTITRLYKDYASASQAVRALEGAGFKSSDISVVASNADGWYKTTKKQPQMDRDHDGVNDRVAGAEAGAGIGVLAGGATGLLAALGLIAIPGVGPVVAAGWLVATAVAVAAGGAAGGIIGALTQIGVSEEDADFYAEGVRRGGTLVTARVNDSERARFEALLQPGAVDIMKRRAAYKKAGWQRFDAAAPPFSADEVRTERAMY